MTAARAAGEVIRVAVADLARRPLAAVLSMGAMGVAIYLIAVFLGLSHGTRAVYDQFRRTAVVEVYLKEGVPESEVAGLEGGLRRAAPMASIERIDSARALFEFRTQFPDLGKVDQLLDENPFFASLRVHMNTSDPAAVDRLVAQARAHPAAESVRYDREWMEALAQIATLLRRLVLAGITLLLLAALTTIGSVVRLTLDDKRDEVALLKLVGAPTFLVLAPLLLAGGLLGGIGSAVAVQLARLSGGWILDTAAVGPLGGLVDTLLGRPVTPAESLGLIGLGLFAGALAAALAAGRAALR